MGVKYSDTIERMRWAGKLKNDSAVARVLGVTPQALSNYKKRGELPTDLVIRFSNIYGLSVDWLLTGEGDVHKIGYQPPEGDLGLPAFHEEAARYGAVPGISYTRAPDIAAMSPDQIIYVGKLLTILRGSNKNAAEAIKYSIDAFYRAASIKKKDEVPTAEEPKKDEATTA